MVTPPCLEGVKLFRPNSQIDIIKTNNTGNLNHQAHGQAHYQAKQTGTI